MDVNYDEQADLERRISDAGWHIVRDDETADGFAVEFQHAPPAEYVPGAETLTVTGQNRTDAYRRFLDHIAAQGAVRR